MRTLNLKSVAEVISEGWSKFQYLKASQCDLDCIPLRHTFVSLIFYSLRSIYAQNSNPMAYWLYIKHLSVVRHHGFDPKWVLRILQLPRCHRNFNAICPCAAELERCNRFSNCRTLGDQIGQMDLRVGGPSCTGSAADESPDYTLLF